VDFTDYEIDGRKLKIISSCEHNVERLEIDVGSHHVTNREIEDISRVIRLMSKPVNYIKLSSLVFRERSSSFREEERDYHIMDGHIFNHLCHVESTVVEVSPLDSVSENLCPQTFKKAFCKYLN